MLIQAASVHSEPCYCKFLKGCSMVSAAAHALLKKYVEFPRGLPENSKTAGHFLKTMPTSVPLLVRPASSRYYELHTDGAPTR